MAERMITDDGWSVELATYTTGAAVYRVKYLDHLVGPGRYFDLDTVREVMGDAFARLREER